MRKRRDLYMGYKGNCRKCTYYFITWDVKFPYGCRIFGVKSKQEPSIIVYQSTGKFCENFEDKKENRI